jgi:hypothetical protein
MVDESKDVTRKEQMSLCIRYITMPNFNIHEEFLVLKHMISVDAESLYITIVETLKELGLNRCVVVAQCYDGASVMSGTISGVQARVRQIHSCAVYIHCHSHRLNLVIADVCRDVKSAGEFFALVELLYVFITRQKVHEIFIRLQKERDLSI